MSCTSDGKRSATQPSTKNVARVECWSNNSRSRAVLAHTRLGNSSIDRKHDVAESADLEVVPDVTVMALMINAGRVAGSHDADRSLRPGEDDGLIVENSTNRSNGITACLMKRSLELLNASSTEAP
jgi:hypothetical protein